MNRTFYIREGQVIEQDISYHIPSVPYVSDTPACFDHKLFLWYHQSSSVAYPVMANAFFPKCHIRFLSQGLEYKLEAKVWLHEMR